MKFILAAILVAHGIAHLVGLVASWRLATFAEMSYKTTVLAGGIDAGDVGIRLLGVLWLVAALACMVAAAANATGAEWATRFTLAVVLASSIMCVLGWPEARIGLAVNVGLVAVVLMRARPGILAFGH